MSGLIERVRAVLDRRLTPDADRPLALALSGGGDSLALLHLAADWAGLNGRRLLVLTVDHGLSAASADWTAFAGRAALSLGAEWRALPWTGAKPETGLPAAARAARHALLADAARQAGARVILMGHTADDVAESDWMRGQGSTLGRLHEWSPSPAWPQGRGVMLLRPLLGVRRGELRAFLESRGASWLEDPANADPRFLRSRARAALAGEPVSPAPARDQGKGEAVLGEGPLAWAGALRLPTKAPAAVLAAAMLSVSGGASAPRGPRVKALHARLVSGDDFAATLSGARADVLGGAVLISREPGRSSLPEAALPVAEPFVWDGRFEITADQAGWRVGALKGRMAGLSDADRAAVRALPAALRPSLPVLFRDGVERPVLAWRGVRTRCLVAGRLLAAVGGIGHEGELDTVIGETPSTDLFLDPGEDIRPRVTRGNV